MTRSDSRSRIEDTNDSDQPGQFDCGLSDAKQIQAHGGEA